MEYRINSLQGVLDLRFIGRDLLFFHSTIANYEHVSIKK